MLQSTVFVGGIEINCAPDIKTLCVTVDEKTTFSNNHIEIAVHASKNISAIQRIWIFSDVKRMLPSVLVRSATTNGIVSVDMKQLLFHCSHFDLLGVIQRSAKRFYIISAIT